MVPSSVNGNKLVVYHGTFPASHARNAIDSAFSKSNLPGAGWTIVHFTTAAQISSYLGGGTVLGANLANTGIIYISTQNNTVGDLTIAQVAAINAGAGAIANFVGRAGNPSAD